MGGERGLFGVMGDDGGGLFGVMGGDGGGGGKGCLE